MAKYRVLAKSFIGNALVEEGTVVEYDGLPSENLEPIDKDAKKALSEAQKVTPEQSAEGLHLAAESFVIPEGDPEPGVASLV